MITKSDDYTLGTDDAQEAYGYMVWMSGASKTLTLPAVAAGMSFCLYSTDANAKTIDPNGSDRIRLNGAASSDGLPWVRLERGRQKRSKGYEEDHHPNPCSLVFCGMGRRAYRLHEILCPDERHDDGCGSASGDNLRGF